MSRAPKKDERIITVGLPIWKWNLLAEMATLRANGSYYDARTTTERSHRRRCLADAELWAALALDCMPARPAAAPPTEETAPPPSPEN